MTGFSTFSVSADADAGNHTKWLGVSKVLGPNWLKMPILTVGMLGLQIIWSVEMSYASPYLLSLGLSKSLMSMVFLAGPLSGLIVQPLIGVLSDGSHSRFGRRRPYIFFGVIVSFGAMYLFGFTRQFASLVTAKGSSANDALTVGLAIFSIYCIDFSINAVQAMDRTLLVDVLPASEQEKGNAWAGRMFGLGSVIGFFVGNVDLTQSLPFLGGTQLEILCGVTASLLVITHFITVFSVKERILRRSTDGTCIKFGLWNVIKDIWYNFFGLPRSIKQICLIQLFAWIGWFPVLFWTSLYVVPELTSTVFYNHSVLRSSPVPETDVAWASLEAEATRLGSRALLYNALASLIASVVCPFFVSNASGSTKDSPDSRGSKNENRWLGDWNRRWRQRPKCHLAVLWGVSHGVFAACMLSTFLINDVAAATAVMTVSGFSWAITQWAPFALIAEAIHWESSVNSTHYILGDMDDESDGEDVGVPLRDWRMEHAPDEEVRLGNVNEGRHLITEAKEEEDYNEDRSSVPTKHVRFEDMGSDSDATPRTMLLGLNASAQQSQGNSHVADTGDAVLHMVETIEDEGVGVSMGNSGDSGVTTSRTIEDMVGIILGIHNVFIVIPQFIISGLSSILFAIMDPDKSGLTSHGAPAHPGSLPDIPIENRTIDRPLSAMTRTMLPRAEGEVATRSADSVAMIFRIGGVSAAIACVLALRLAQELQRTHR